MISSKSITIFSDYEALSIAAADHVYQALHDGLQEKGKFVFGCATGGTPARFYQQLLSLLQQHPVSLRSFFTVNLDEYYPMPQSNEQSYYSWMKRIFWHPLQQMNLSFDYERQVLIPDGDVQDPRKEAKQYEDKIRTWGGIDVQILGIGENGHIGFNEPGSERGSRMRLVSLTESTRRTNAKFFGGDIQAVPKQAITMGVETILEAKEILVLVSGKQKAEIMKKIFSAAEPTSDIPATYLLKHPHTHWFFDTDAAALM